MNPKLTEILKKAKAVDKRTSQIDRSKITGSNTTKQTL